MHTKLFDSNEFVTEVLTLLKQPATAPLAYEAECGLLCSALLHKQLEIVFIVEVASYVLENVISPMSTSGYC